MTTSKVIISSKDAADRNILPGRAILMSAFVSSVIMVGIVNLLGFHEFSAMAGGASLLTSLATSLWGYRKYAKQRVEFLQSISDAVKKETGHEMSPKSIMNFLISGKAEDDKGNSLRVQNTREELQVLLVSEPVSL